MTRTMITVNIDRADSVLLHDQVAAEIRRDLARVKTVLRQKRG